VKFNIGTVVEVDKFLYWQRQEDSD